LGHAGVTRGPLPGLTPWPSRRMAATFSALTPWKWRCNPCGRAAQRGTWARRGIWRCSAMRRPAAGRRGTGQGMSLGAVR
jgi:hypothetical protein